MIKNTVDVKMSIVTHYKMQNAEYVVSYFFLIKIYYNV